MLTNSLIWFFWVYWLCCSDWAKPYPLPVPPHGGCSGLFLSRGAAGLEGFALVMVEQWWAQRGPSREGPTAHLCPQPPQSHWPRGAVIPISGWLEPSRRLAGPALSPAAPVAPDAVRSPRPRPPSPGAGAGFGPSEGGGDSWAVEGPPHPQTWPGPCFSLSVNHVHYRRNVQTACTVRRVRQVEQIIHKQKCF